MFYRAEQIRTEPAVPRVHMLNPAALQQPAEEFLGEVPC